MRRREFVTLLGGAALAFPPASDALAQTPSGTPRIGYLDTIAALRRFEAFRRGLSELGYVEGRTIIIERRSGAGQAVQLSEMAAELVRLQPRVIVASGPPATLAAKNTTASIPIVITNANDPVGLGLVASLGRPGGNITGLSSLSTGLMGKRLELLAEMVPGLSRIGVIWRPGDEGNEIDYRELHEAAVTLRLALDSFGVTRPGDFDAAFQAAGARTGGVIMMSSAMANTHREIVVAAAARHKVVTIYYGLEFAEAGGLMSYGANVSDLHRRAAVFVDKILKGARPADLPVEEPTRFELVVNLKTTKALGIAIPQSILVRIDDVIE